MYLFEQIVRISCTKSILDEFWAKTVDNPRAQKETSVHITDIIGPLSETEVEKLFGKTELTQLRFSKRNSSKTKTAANKRLDPDAG
jgi:hypothetical protein